MAENEIRELKDDLNLVRAQMVELAKIVQAIASESVERKLELLVNKIHNKQW
jgi:hypothetical protein